MFRPSVPGKKLAEFHDQTETAAQHQIVGADHHPVSRLYLLEDVIPGENAVGAAGSVRCVGKLDRGQVVGVQPGPDDGAGHIKPLVLIGSKAALRVFVKGFDQIPSPEGRCLPLQHGAGGGLDLAGLFGGRVAGIKILAVRKNMRHKGSSIAVSLLHLDVHSVSPPV